MKKAGLVIALLCGVIAVAVWMPRGRPEAAAALPRVKPAVAAPVSPVAPAPVVAPSTPSGVSSAPPSSEVQHPNLQQVLPGLSAPATDWRAFAPQRLTVRPIPGVAIEFAVQRVTSDGRHTVWVGTSGTPGVTLVSSGTRDRWDAVLTIPSALEYDIHVSPAGVVIEKKDFAAEKCKPAGPGANDTAAAMMPSVTPAGAPAAEAATVYTADVLVLYTTATGTSLGGATAVENDATALIATANTYLAQSQVDDLQWRLVGVVEATGYTETGNLTTDLTNLESSRTALGSFAAQQRNTVGADEVMLIVNGSTDGFAGIAETPGSFAVMIRAGGAGTLAHELAHNFGCFHDRQTEMAPDNDGQYHYGYRYLDTSGRDTGTIMSYAAFRVPYYSNPSLTYQGHILGLPAGDPKAADNARVLRENAAIVAGFRAPVGGGAPTITAQPASVTITAGQPFALAVTATGNSLTYQWSHDGMNIPAGTGASYSVGSSMATDAGAYTVTVSNSSGVVASSPAMVTVSAATPSMGPPPSGSASGGGGGAYGALGALAVLAVLAGARRARRSPQAAHVRRAAADN